MKNTRQSLILFFGMLLMLFFTFFGQTILRDLKELFLISKLGVERIPELRMMDLPLTIMAGLILLVISWGGKVHRGFFVFFPLNTIVLVVFGILSYFQSPLLYKPSVVSGFYHWANISLVLSVALIWGFANQTYTFSVAAIQYPILAFLLTYAVLPTGMFAHWANTTPLSFEIFCIAVATTSLLTLFVYFVMNRIDLGVIEIGSIVSWGYWVALAVLVFGIKYGSFFPIIFLKGILKEVYPDPSNYNAYLLALTTLKANWLVITGVFGIFVGFFLYKTGASYWAIVGRLLWIVMFVGGLIAFYSTVTSITAEGAWVGTIGNVLLAVFLALFMIIAKELAYFGIEHRHRFSAKIIVDVIVYSLVATASAFTSSATLTWGSIVLNRNLFAVIFVVSFLIGLAGIYRIHKDLKFGLPGPYSSSLKRPE
jgi:hypothetical protein